MTLLNHENNPLVTMFTFLQVIDSRKAQLFDGRKSLNDSRLRRTVGVLFTPLAEAERSFSLLSRVKNILHSFY